MTGFVIIVVIILLVWFGNELFKSYFEEAKEDLIADQLEGAEKRAVKVIKASKALDKLEDENGGKLPNAQELLKKYRGES